MIRTIIEVALDGVTFILLTYWIYELLRILYYGVIKHFED